MDFSTLEVGDEVEREGEVSFRAIVEEISESGNEIILRLKITKASNSYGCIGELWTASSDLHYMYKLISKNSQQEPEPHIAGLSPERIDWSAHKAFLREHF